MAGAGRPRILRWLAEINPATGAVSAGVVLLAIPTVFAVFPEAAVNRTVWWRALIVAGWAGIAVFVVLGGVRRDLDSDWFLGAHRRRRQRANETAAADILSEYLRGGTHGTPVGYSWTVYLNDPESGYLVSVFPNGEGPASIRSFRPGRGATGLAFEAEGLIVVTGNAVSDDRHGLTSQQQDFFRPYQAVAAIPIRGEDDRPIGCLSAISRVNDRYFEEPAGAATLRELAQVVSVLMTRVHLEGQ